MEHGGGGGGGRGGGGGGGGPPEILPLSGDSLIVLWGSGQVHNWFKTHLQTISPVVVEM